MRIFSLRLFFSILSLGLALPPLLSAEGSGVTIEKVRRDAVIELLRDQDIPFEDRPLLTEYGGFNRSIHVAIPPRPAFNTEPGETTRSFMLAIPLSTQGETTGTLPFNILTGLAFIEKIRSRGSGIEIRVAFLGDEGSRFPRDFQREIHAGLADLISLPEIPENTALWYLDLANPPERLFIHHGSEKSIAPLELISPLTELSARHRIPYSLAIRYNEIYKLALADGPSALAVTRDRGINALYVTGTGDAGERIYPDALAELLMDYTASLHLLTENIDTHFSIIPFRERNFFISEWETAAIIILMAAAFGLYLGIYSIPRRTRLFLRRRNLLRHFWRILLFLTILVAALRGAGLFFSWLCRLFNLPLPIRYDAAGLCFIFAMLLFSLSVPLVDLIPVPWKAAFYGDAALLMVSAGLLAAMALDITFTLIFIWAFLFILIGTLVRNSVLVYVSALATPVQAAFVLFNTMEQGNRKLASAFLEGNWLMTLYIALFCLPFILLIKRGVLIWRKHHPRRLSRALIPRLVMGGLNVFLLVFFVWWNAGNLPAPPVYRTVEEAEAKLPLMVSIEDHVFLESRILNVAVEAPGIPARFDLSLESGRTDRPPDIYSAPMPQEIRGNTLSFILGEAPPNPFTAELVLPLGFSGTFRAEALYTAWDGAVDPEPAPLPETGDYVLRLVKSVPVAPASPADQDAGALR